MKLRIKLLIWRFWAERYTKMLRKANYAKAKMAEQEPYLSKHLTTTTGGQ